LAVDCGFVLGSDATRQFWMLPSGGGFQVDSGSLHFFFIGRNSPLVTNVNTFWFGHERAREDNLWNNVSAEALILPSAGIAFSWQNVTVPAWTTVELRAILRFNAILGRPTLVADSIPERVSTEDIVKFTGLVLSETATRLVLVISVDNKAGVMHNVNNGRFSVGFSLSEHAVGPGNHTFRLIASDPFGWSAPVTLPCTVVVVVTRSPLVSDTASPVPSMIELNMDHTTIIESRFSPVTLTGTGRLIGRGNVPFILTVVTITDGSSITSDGMTVTRELRMEGSASLEAASGDWVSLGNGAELTMVGHDDLPTLNLGAVGDAYLNCPSHITVELGHAQDNTSLNHVLVRGQTLAGCEGWARVARVRPSTPRLKFECQPPCNESLRKDGARALVLVSNPSWDAHDDPQWVLPVITAGAILLIVVAIVVVWAVARRQKREGRLPKTAFYEPTSA
jgi:hypothetical protein